MDISFNSAIPGYSYQLQTKENAGGENETTEESSDKESAGVEGLSEGERAQVQELQARDTEVRAHEAAHQGGGGGAATFTYQQGPDGKMYAIGGEVPITIKSGSTPEETIANAMQVIAAATAPANPSAQDMAVAASAKSLMIKAQQEKMKESLEQNKAQETYKSQDISLQKQKPTTPNFDISA